MTSNWGIFFLASKYCFICLSSCSTRCFPGIFFILLPVRQDMSDSWRVGESVNILEVFLGDLERTSSDVGNVLFDQLAGINCGLVDLLEKE